MSGTVLLVLVALVLLGVAVLLVLVVLVSLRRLAAAPATNAAGIAAPPAGLSASALATTAPRAGPPTDAGPVAAGQPPPGLARVPTAPPEGQARGPTAARVDQVPGQRPEVDLAGFGAPSPDSAAHSGPGSAPDTDPDAAPDTASDAAPDTGSDAGPDSAHRSGPDSAPRSDTTPRSDPGLPATPALETARAEAARLLSVAQSDVVRLQEQAEADAVRIRRRAAVDAEAVRARAQEDIAAAARRAELDAAAAADQLRRAADADATQARVALAAGQADLTRRESHLTERVRELEAERLRVHGHEQQVTAAGAEVEQARRDLDGLEAERVRALEHAAALTRDDARTELVRVVEQQAKREAALTVRDIEQQARELGELRARAIVADVIARVASEQTAESVVSVLHLPSDDMKGRIIGREGRNVRAFEHVTGVNLVIDDTPEAVLLSCFDPVRREVGRLTLEHLVLDGRIHPHRIEEMYERARLEVEASCTRAGEDALLEVGITEVHPELVDLLGRLRYRTSYGQNVLKHLVETAHIASMMASELHMDPALVKRGAFFHDIGKALTHEVEGSHALVGADLARRCGEPEEVVHAIAAHHGEVAPETVEAVLTQASDSCSGGRPGARRESLESYVQRLHRIEEIAAGKPGVDKVFAMQAGREVRIMVLPEEVDDVGALVLAREVARQIEDELTYPGQVRVTVVRESRATEVAH